MRNVRSLGVVIALSVQLSGCSELVEILGLAPPSPLECTTSVLGCPTGEGSSFFNAFNPTIAGYPVYCVAPSGQAVATIVNNTINDIARASNGAPPLIEINTNIFFQLPRKMQLYVYGHECAHHALGHTLGFVDFTSESQADCLSIRIGKQQGWLSRAEVVAFAPYLANNPGTPWGHLPGPQRAQLLVQCWDAG